MIRCDLYSRGMKGLKRSFVIASEPVNFTIFLLHAPFAVIEPFELKNNLTGERLTFRRFSRDKWLLVRCPIGREEDKWSNWETEAIKFDWFCHWNSKTVTSATECVTQTTKVQVSPTSELDREWNLMEIKSRF